MVDVTKKAAGYIQVKLIPADRNGGTWSGWSQRWVDLMILSQNSGQSKREVWIEIRKTKSSGKPIKMWTVDAKDTLLYRCTSKRKAHAFAIQYRGKDIVYLCGNSEIESNDWMKIIRESLCPTDRIVELEVSTERLFEASVIDNKYSASCGLFGKYGHLACRENKLIMFDNNGSNVIQEWYLHTIRKLEAFKANDEDEAQILTVYLGENSSTGCGSIYYFCPKAVSLLKSIQTRIRDIFNNIADDLKVQQATLMSLGALHDVSLEEPEVKSVMMTLVIADEIIKAKQELSQSKRLQALKPVVREATNKNEPFVWQDNEYYDESAVVARVPVRADYTPPDEEAPRKPRRASLSQAFSFTKRPRAHSANPGPDSAKDGSFRKAENQARRSSLPQSGRFRPKSPSKNSEGQFDFQIQKFQHMLNLADPENSEQIFPVVGSPKGHSCADPEEWAQTTATQLSALDECSEGTTSRSASLSSFNVSLNEDKVTDVVDSKPKTHQDTQTPNEPASLPPAETESSKTDNEDSLTEELGDVTVESIDSINLDAAREPELDLRLREPGEEEVLQRNQETAAEVPRLADPGAMAQAVSQVAEESVGDVIAQSVARVAQSLSNVGTDTADAQEGPAPTIEVTNDDRRASTDAVKISFGAPPPKPKRASKIKN